MSNINNNHIETIFNKEKPWNNSTTKRARGAAVEGNQYTGEKRIGKEKLLLWDIGGENTLQILSYEASKGYKNKTWDKTIKNNG